MSQYFNKNISLRLSGALLGATIFFIITNFGVWTTGVYGYTISGVIECYTLAIPFFTYSVLSTFLFAAIIESFYKIYSVKFSKI